MDLSIGDILDLLEFILSLFVLCVFIFAATTAYGWKGFLAIVGGIAALIFILDGFEKLLDYIFDTRPELIIVILAVFAVIMIAILILGVKQQYQNLDKKGKQKYVKRLLKDTVIIIGTVAVSALLIYFGFKIFIFH